MSELENKITDSEKLPLLKDVEDAVLRLCPFLTSDQSTQFSGWARMALPVSKFSIVEVWQSRLISVFISESKIISLCLRRQHCIIAVEHIETRPLCGGSRLTVPRARSLNHTWERTIRREWEPMLQSTLISGNSIAFECFLFTSSSYFAASFVIHHLSMSANQGLTQGQQNDINQILAQKWQKSHYLVC